MASMHESKKKLAYFADVMEAVAAARQKIVAESDSLLETARQANFGKLNAIVNPMLVANQQFCNMFVDIQKNIVEQAEIYANSPAVEAQLKDAARKIADEASIKTVDFAYAEATGLEENYDSADHGVKVTEALLNCGKARYDLISTIAESVKVNNTDDTKEQMKIIGTKVEESCNDFVKLTEDKKAECDELGINLAKLQETLIEAANGFKGANISASASGAVTGMDV